MIKTIYLDVLFSINFIINYLLLFSTAHMSGASINRIRIAFSASLGAVYGVFVFFESFKALSFLVIKLFIAVIMILIAFGRMQSVKLIRLTLIFFGLSFGFAGAVLAIYYFTSGVDGLFDINNFVLYINIPMGTLLLSTLLAYILFSLIFKRSASVTSREICGIEVVNLGKKIVLQALVDTGNSLRAPFTNAQVIIAEYEAVRKVIPEEARRALDKAEVDSFPLVFEILPFKYKFQLIPYKTMNSGFELLLAFKPEKVTINGLKSDGALIALSPKVISDGGAYTALIS